MDANTDLHAQAAMIDNVVLGITLLKCIRPRIRPRIVDFGNTA